jgi:hypothetical protein
MEAMKIKNHNCDGAHCRESLGEVRVYPCPDGEVILCEGCFAHYNAIRASMRKQAVSKETRDKWPEVKWHDAKVSDRSATPIF